MNHYPVLQLVLASDGLGQAKAKVGQDFLDYRRLLNRAVVHTISARHEHIKPSTSQACLIGHI